MMQYGLDDTSNGDQHETAIAVAGNGKEASDKDIFKSDGPLFSTKFIYTTFQNDGHVGDRYSAAPASPVSPCCAS
ncbi:hypothetical protein E4U54_006706 [Claviceps lovelessii]|nr:hypothetical protein E4U54_006706 [Claviceps lovelessii]